MREKGVVLRDHGMHTVTYARCLRVKIMRYNFAGKARTIRYAHTSCSTSNSSTARVGVTVFSETTLVAIAGAYAIVIALSSSLCCVDQCGSASGYTFECTIFANLAGLLCTIFRGMRICPGNETSTWPVALVRTGYYTPWRADLSYHAAAIATKFVKRFLALPVGC